MRKLEEEAVVVIVEMGKDEGIGFGRTGGIAKYNKITNIHCSQLRRSEVLNQ